MNLNILREGELKDVFDAFEEAFSFTGTDHYIIGALARNVWYSRGNKTFRQTKDIDFAVLVGSQENYDTLKQYLKENKNFVDAKGNSFVMMSISGVLVDILPFGEIEIDSVNGFMEVYQSGTEQVEMTTGHNFMIATLPSIILLKLIAFDDRPEMRTKDARDIANIISHFFELQADFIYNEHADLFSDEEKDITLQEISAIVIGREIKKTCKSNENLLQRIKQILQSHIDLKEESLFIRNMVAETNTTVETSSKQLQNLLSSLQD